MKRFFSAAAALVMMLIFMPSFTMSASAAKNFAKGWDGNTEKSCLVDNADLFSPQQEKELNSAIRDYAEKLKMNIMIYVGGPGDIRSDHDTLIFADDFYDETYGEDTDGILFFMDFTGKSPAYDYISTSGEAVIMYASDLDSILEGVHNYFPASSVTDYSAYNEQLYDGVMYFLARFDSSRSTYHKSLFEYQHDNYSGKYFYYKFGKLYITKSKPPAMRMLILFAAVAVGGLVAVIIYFSTKASYKFKASTNARVYVSADNGVERFGWQDQFIRSYQTKTRIESNSGGGGGGHRSGGGGGHSHSGGHGGAGRHR